MHFTAVVISLVLAPVGALAWAKAGNGVWVANNKVYPQVGSYKNVHESCTRMNSNIVLTSGDCAYWTNSKGEIGHGYCHVTSNSVECKRGCPDPFDVCSYAETDGSCSHGYSACLQKMGCDGRSGGADCIGTATGCAAACH
ncbi:hypothetical protein B0H63DRAFT_534079 [Podospora didyma]|uniref:Uncharacterized protein n=1 Tax=Podospora didyma TaxID=330526 RepID=A0AAE0P8L1_9PEZI|nr:hypothetical protein B0H63DRAFT_534079 [Podospora didyma]